MHQYDDGTAVPVMPAPSAPGSPGFFTDGNPGQGQIATILRAEYMNMLMMELLNVLSAAGVTPDKTNHSQLALAISELIGGLGQNLQSAANGAGADLVGGVGRIVGTVAGVRALSKTGVGRAFALGGTAPGDGAGGQYWYNAADTTSADNGGTILVGADGGRWYLSHVGPLSIRQAAAVGDGVTSNAATIAVTEAGADSSYVVPDGVFALPDATTLLKEYTGPGKWSFGGVQIPMTKRSRVHEAIQRASTVLGDLTQFEAAIQSRAATVVFAGDSITEGVFNICYEDSWAGMLADEFRRRMPGVAWNFQNLSQAGMGLGSLQSNSFVGGATNDYSTIFNRPKGTSATYATTNANLNVITQFPDLWPNGSTTALSWRDHIKAAAPDLLVIAMGANDVTNTAQQEAGYYAALLTYVRGWTKVPSVVIVTTPIATRKQATWRGYAANLQVMADTARAFALANNCTLIDSNRQYLMLRDGQDIARLSSQAVSATVGFPTNWTSNAGMPTLSAATLTFTAAAKINNSDTGRGAKDLTIAAQFNAAVTGQAFGLIYRGQYEAQVNGSNLIVYYGVTNLTSVPITPLVGGTTNFLQVRCMGARHQVFLNGVKLIDFIDYSSLSWGGIGCEMNGAGTVADLSVIQGIPRTVGPAILTEDELLGISTSEYWNNPNTKGGDGIHHPSSLGHYAIYFAPALGLVEAAERIYAAAPAAKSIIANGANNTAGAASPAAPTSYLSVDGFVQLCGSLSASGAVATNSPVATLDVAHRPNREVDGIAYIAATGTICYLRVLANGQMYIGTAATAGQSIVLDGFSFKQFN